MSLGKLIRVMVNQGIIKGLINQYIIHFSYKD